MFKSFVVCLILLTCCDRAHGFTASAVPDTIVSGQKIRFQSAIREYVSADSVDPPPREAICFIGSSIFRQWTSLQEDMAPLPVYNRAFGGSRTIEVLYYMDLLVLPHDPKIVVYYCGSNDVNGNQPADSIASRFFQFAERLADSLPRTKVFYVSVNRAPQKRAKWASVDSVNALVRTYCDGHPAVTFIDVNPALFTETGEPRLELFKDDLLHFKPTAYREFARIIKPYVERAWRELSASPPINKE